MYSIVLYQKEKNTVFERLEFVHQSIVLISVCVSLEDWICAIRDHMNSFLHLRFPDRLVVLTFLYFGVA